MKNNKTKKVNKKEPKKIATFMGKRIAQNKTRKKYFLAFTLLFSIKVS